MLDGFVVCIQSVVLVVANKQIPKNDRSKRDRSMIKIREK